MKWNRALWRTVFAVLVGTVLAAPCASTAFPAEGQEMLDRKASPDPLAEEWEVSLSLPFSIALNPAVSALRGKLTEDGTTLLEEDFESDWPDSPWRIFHDLDAADVTWGKTDYRASEGSFAIWCAAFGSDSPGDGGAVPTDTASWVTAGPFDLTETVTVDLTFDLWLKTELYYDAFMWLVSTDGINFSGRATTTNTSGWTNRHVSLDDLGGGIAIGSEQVWIAFVYTSDRSNSFEGAYIDNVLMVADAGSPGEEGYTYTTDQDFALGTMIGVFAEDDTLQLSEERDAFPFLWVPNTDLGSASKVDVLSGAEVGRYRTGPPRDLEPGPIAVDLEGSCWVGNRVGGTLVKIGLEENGGCVDSNGNGRIDTSRDDNGNGAIDSSEVLEWGDDECVLFEVVLVEGVERVYVPGTVHNLYGPNNLLAVAVDAGNNVWAGVADSTNYYHLDGVSGEVKAVIDTAISASAPTGGVVDSDGILWSAVWPEPWVLRIDPATGEQTKVELDHGSRGLALDDARHLFVTGDSESAMSRIDLDAEAVDQNIPAEFSSMGVTTTQDNNVWVAAPELETVTRYTNRGVVVQTLEVPIGPVAVASDGRGGLWVAGVTSDLLVRIDPSFNDIDMEVPVGDALHLAAGDMTGVVARNLTTRIGTWTVVYDSLLTNMEWGTLTWTASEPQGTLVTVRARSSNGTASWSAWEDSNNGADLQQTPPGRYLEIQVSMQWVSDGTPPTLELLTVTPAPPGLPPDAGFTWTPEEPVAEASVQFTDTSTEAPTSWLWSFGDTYSSAEQNPSHSFSAVGAYTVTLEASNSYGSDTISQEITVVQPTCSLECSATAPATGLVEEALFFESTTTVEECEGPLTQTWTFGDGATSSAQNPRYAYHAAGDYTWVMAAAIDDQTCSQTGGITITEDGPEECVNTYWLPVASRAAGASGSVWRTNLGLQGGSTGTAAVELRFHGPAGTESRSLGVGVRAMVELSDVVDWIAGDIQASGPVEVCADGPLTVSARTYNLLADTDPCRPGGTFGQYMAGLKAAAGLVSNGGARLTQLKENDDFRTNIGLLNAGAETAEVEINLFDEFGVEVMSYSVIIEPAQWLQDNRPFLNRAGVDDLDAGWARIDVVSGEGVFAYASVIDNLTNDAMTVPMR